MITVPDGGYDLEKVTDTQTEVTIQNTFEGYGFGKLIVGFATTAAVKDAPALTERIELGGQASDRCRPSIPPCVAVDDADERHHLITQGPGRRA